MKEEEISIKSAEETIKKADAYVSKITKTKIPLGDSFVKETNRIHLRRLFPFLKNDYRTLDKKDLNNKETLHEIFGESETDFTKLEVIFNYQSII